MSSPTKLIRRLGVFIALLGLIVVLLGLRLVDFQIVRAAEIQQESMKARSVLNTLTALRGQIVDSQDQVLARTVFRYDVNVAPKNVGPVFKTVDGVKIELSVEQITRELAAILGLPFEEIAPKLIGDSEYANIAKKVNADVYNQIRDLGIPWVYTDTFSDRLYPDGAVAGNVIGFVGADGTPLAGLELQYNPCLAGVDGQEAFERSPDGVRIPSSTVTTQPTEDGGTLKLTIDSNLQFFAQQVMADTVNDTGAKWASAIVIEAKTGRILAAAEAPSVDPNDPAGVEAADRGSRIFQTAFEPGSIMKSLTAAMVVDTGTADEFDTRPAPDYMKLDFADGSIKDSFNHEDYTLTLAGVLRYSSNTGISNFGIEIPSATRYKYLEKFGFGTESEVHFEGESSGILHPYETWDKMTNYATMFGQGVSVTTIQMASAYQAIANGGVRLDPVLVDSCTKSDGSVVQVAPQSITRVVKESTADLTLELMEKVVEFGGVGKTAQIPGYRVGGKTGTAQLQEGTGYGSQYAISFYGVAPIEDPEFIVGISIYKPIGASNSAGTTAPFKAIMQQVLKTYRVPPSTTKSRNIPSNKYGLADAPN